MRRARMPTWRGARARRSDDHDPAISWGNDEVGTVRDVTVRIAEEKEKEGRQDEKRRCPPSAEPPANDDRHHDGSGNEGPPRAIDAHVLRS
jgi:hypothetical protein